MLNINSNQFLMIVCAISFLIALISTSFDPVISSILWSLAIVVICFYFLDSNSDFTINSGVQGIVLGGAIAGFFILFLTFLQVQSNYVSAQLFYQTEDDERIEVNLEDLVKQEDILLRYTGQTELSSIKEIDLQLVHKAPFLGDIFCSSKFTNKLCTKEEYRLKMADESKFIDRDLRIDNAQAQQSPANGKNNLRFFEELSNGKKFYVGVVEDEELSDNGYPSITNGDALIKSLNELVTTEGLESTALAAIREACILDRQEFCSFPINEVVIQPVSGQTKGEAAVCHGGKLADYGNATLELTLTKPKNENGISYFSNTKGVRIKSIISRKGIEPCIGDNTDKLIRINESDYKDISRNIEVSKSKLPGGGNGYARVNVPLSIGEYKLPSVE